MKEILIQYEIIKGKIHLKAMEGNGLENKKEIQKVLHEIIKMIDEYKEVHHYPDN